MDIRPVARIRKPDHTGASTDGDGRFSGFRHRLLRWGLLSLLTVLAVETSRADGEATGPVRYVIHVSVDGLRPDAITRHDPDELPNFYRLRSEGSFTDNARTDVDYGNTMPNHLAQLTGRPVLGEDGHGWTMNHDPESAETIHEQKGAYVPSIFDVVHDAGLRTAAYVSKPKFALLSRSYDAANGAEDVTGADDGRDKIDQFVLSEDTQHLVDDFVDAMREEPFHYTFLHLRDPDIYGHRWGWRLWSWHPYMSAVRHVDALLGELFDLIDDDPNLADRTAIVLTSDHGGSGHSHGAERRAHYTVPFFVWGPSIEAADLYEVSEGRFTDPGRDRPRFDAPTQPIRNGMAGNAAAALLGLDPISGSTLRAAAIVPAPNLVQESDSSRPFESVRPE